MKMILRTKSSGIKKNNCKNNSRYIDFIDVYKINFDINVKDLKNENFLISIKIIEIEIDRLKKFRVSISYNLDEFSCSYFFLAIIRLGIFPT